MTRGPGTPDPAYREWANEHFPVTIDDVRAQIQETMDGVAPANPAAGGMRAMGRHALKLLDCVGTGR